MRNLIGGLTVTALLAAAMLALAVPARAEVHYPWCAQYQGGRYGIDATNCGFDTWKQCMDTIRGIGGICYENPFYSERVERRTIRRHKRRVRD